MSIKIKFLLIFFLVNSNLYADADVQAGKKIVLEGGEKDKVACLTCHQENGEGMQESGFPHLAGMSDKYISKQLKDFQEKRRITDVMSPIALGLTEQEIQDVAAYYSKLPVVIKIEISKSSNNFDQGRLIATRGIWSKNIPACFACHGPNASGVGDNFPPLTNQGKLYLTKELLAWQKGTRKNDPASLMRTIAKKLTKKEIEAVSEYLSSDLNSAEAK